MRIRITGEPFGIVDGFDVGSLVDGREYDVSLSIANQLIDEGWAAPVEDGPPALVLPLNHPIAERIGPKTLSGIAADRPPRRRSKR